MEKLLYQECQALLQSVDYHLNHLDIHEKGYAEELCVVYNKLKNILIHVTANQQVVLNVISE